MMHNSADAAAVVVALVASISCGCGGAREQPKFPVRVVMSAQVYTALPVILAPALGYYDEEGLAVQIENVQSNPRAVHALSGGSADVSTGSFGQVLSLAGEGRDVKAFTTMMFGSQQVMVASPAASKSIRSVQDLRGVAVGVGGSGGPAHQLVNWLLAQHGLSPSDVTIVSIGTLATAVAAVEHSKITAAVLNEVEYLMLRKRGIDPPVLVDLRNRETRKRVYGLEEYPTAVLMATGPWLREHADTARRFARAITRSTQWMRQQSAASVLEKIPTRYRGDRDIDLAAISTALPMYSNTGVMTAEGAEAVKRVLSISVASIRTGNFDLRKTYTNEFVAKR